MKKVILNSIEVGDKTFDLDHAQRILDLGKKNPPVKWKLADPGYILEKGIITEKQKEVPAKI